MEDIGTLTRFIVLALIQLIIIIASFKYYTREKNSIGKLLFWGSLLVLIGYIANSFSFLIFRSIEFDPFIYGLIFGSFRIVSFIGFICFAIGFHKLIKNSKSDITKDLDDLGKN